MELSESYRVLEIDPTECLDEVKQAYRDIVFVWHPDRFGERPRVRQKAEEKLKKINAAYEVLKSHLAHAIPKLSSIEIHPEYVEVEAGEHQSFWAVGYDQHGSEVALEDVEWSVSGGGVMYAEGTFFAEYEPGEYTVTAHCKGVEGTTCLYISVPVSEKLSHQSSSYTESEECNEEEFHKANEPWGTREQKVEEESPILDEGFPWKRLIFWPLMSWVFLSGSSSDSGMTFIESVSSLLVFIWITGIIRPKAVFKFGLSNTRASVTQIYLTLMWVLTTFSEEIYISSFWEGLCFILFSFWIIGMLNPRWVINFGSNSRGELTGYYVLLGILFGTIWGGFKGFIWLFHGTVA
jgi:hypothetical protein